MTGARKPSTISETTINSVIRVTAVVLLVPIAANRSLLTPLKGGNDRHASGSANARPSAGRSGARIAGMLTDAGTDLVILRLAGMSAIPALALLTGWLCICAACGSMSRHFRNDAFFPAGYSGAIVNSFRFIDRVAGPNVALARILCTISRPSHTPYLRPAPPEMPADSRRQSPRHRWPRRGAADRRCRPVPSSTS